MLFLNNAAKVCKVFNNLQIIMGKFFIFFCSRGKHKKRTDAWSVLFSYKGVK